VNFFVEGRQGGMQSLDQHLLDLHQAGLISGTEAMRLANSPEAVAVGLRGLRQTTAAASPSGSVADASSPAAPSRASAAEPGLQP
jgi:Tfp pilus assembly ATPase PilU